jgi:hypothetical protein
MHTLYLGLTCRCVCPILTYRKSSKVHNMMATFFRHSRLPIRVQTGRQEDFNRQSAGIREYLRKLFCVLELSSTPRKKRRIGKRSGKRHDGYFLGKVSQKICIPGSPLSCYTADATHHTSFLPGIFVKQPTLKLLSCLFLISYTFNKPLLCKCYNNTYTIHKPQHSNKNSSLAHDNY